MAERLLAGLVVVPFLLGAAAAPVTETSVLFSFQDSEIVESSGVVVQGDLALTTNDSGDTGRVFAVDMTTGETVGTTSWSSDPIDVEAIAPAGTGSVWVGDIGDNRERRESVQVAKVPVGRGERTVDPVIYDLVYPDGAHDAESLLADPTTGRLYVATKSVLGGTLYAAPATLSANRSNQLTPMGSVLSIATDGAFFPDGRHLVVRSYGAAEVYAFPTLEVVGRVPLPAQPQGEGIAVTGQDGLVLTSEGLHSKVLSATLPEAVDQVVLGTTPTPSTTPDESAGPSAGASSSAPPRTRSREDRELPESTETERPAWPWFLSGLLGVGVILVLARSLRRR